MDNEILKTLRGMAWKRAKGELQSMLETYWEDKEQYRELKYTINAFIKDVEDNGKQE